MLPVVGQIFVAVRCQKHVSHSMKHVANLSNLFFFTIFKLVFFSGGSTIWELLIAICRRLSQSKFVYTATLSDVFDMQLNVKC